MKRKIVLLVFCIALFLLLVLSVPPTFPELHIIKTIDASILVDIPPVVMPILTP